MFNGMYNVLQLSDSLFTGGMPKADQLTDAAKQGVKVVINLAPHDVPHALPDEAELVNSLGMQYINIPVNWNTPTKEGLDKFMDAMDEHKDLKILVHCEANFRASAFVSMYRILREDRSEEHTSELQSRLHLVCRLLLEKKNKKE